MSDTLTVARLVEHKAERLELEHLNPEVPLDRAIIDPELSGPGLALAGFTERFAVERVRVFGETEMTYLRSLDPAVAEQRIEGVFSRQIPCAVVAKGLPVPDYLLSAASRHGVPVLRSALSTRSVFRLLGPFLEQELAPRTTLHGSLADVYGVGLLFTGSSGIGKSECVLDLVERGHRMVADDVVKLVRRGNDVLIGTGHELQRHHMEIRGAGIIDVRMLFGVRAIRQQKRVEVVVHLEKWSTEAEYDRTGLDQTETEILGVSLPRVVVPLNPGKNMGVIAEVIAMNHLLRLTGINSAEAFHESLRRAATAAADYLEEDYE